MIRLHLNPTVLKSLNFNKEDDFLEIEFKDCVPAENHIDIPLSVIQKYVDSIKENVIYDEKNNLSSHLKIVYSNFAS